jgi:hypothetical protein
LEPAPAQAGVGGQRGIGDPQPVGGQRSDQTSLGDVGGGQLIGRHHGISTG